VDSKEQQQQQIHLIDFTALALISSTTIYVQMLSEAFALCLALCVAYALRCLAYALLIDNLSFLLRNGGKACIVFAKRSKSRR